jgi:hypothetical protein
VADEVTMPQPPGAAAAGDEPATTGRPAIPGRRARLRRVLVAAGWSVLVLGLVAAVLAGVALVTGDHGDDRTLRAEPGECLSGDSDRDLRRVGCGDPGVRWTVVGVVEHRSKRQAEQDACRAWSDAEASYWESRNGTDGFVLCLRSVTPG